MIALPALAGVGRHVVRDPGPPIALARALRALDVGVNLTRIVAALDRAEALATDGGIRATHTIGWRFCSRHTIG